MRGAGRAAFAAILLMIAGVLNVIYGIAAVGDGDFFAAQTAYVFSDVETWGWITMILGAIQLTGGVSLIQGHAFGRVIGIFAASFGAIGALLAVGGAHPYWSLGVFALCVIVLHGIVVFDPQDER